MAHPDLPAEQAYLDRAYACLERMRQALLRTVDAAGVGADGADLAARPFYTATPAEPHGVTLRRRFRLDGRRLTGISDEALDGSLADAASSLDDFLLEELERT